MAVRQSIAYGQRTAAAIKEGAAQVLQSVPEIKLEYFELVDPDTIRPVDVVNAPVRAALAAWIGKTRLASIIFIANPGAAQ